MPLGFVTRLAQSLISTLDVLKLGSIEIPNIDVKFNINIRCIEIKQTRTKKLIILCLISTLDVLKYNF